MTVVLLSEDSAFVKGVVTDSKGDFFFGQTGPGSYIISASMIGYVTYFSAVISLGDEDVQLPAITLEESTTQLDELVVQEARQYLDQKIDRLIINLENSITASGNTILEVLQKFPGVAVNRQNNTITMNGKSGVTVMINNKPLQVPLDVVLQMLDGMNASNVEKIELITSPPSEYDAEGNAGIIHIVTKQEDASGTNGSFTLTAGTRWAESFGGNFNINHRNKSSAFFADYSILTNHNLHLFKTEIRYYQNEFAQRVYGYSHRENFTIQQNLSAGLEWKVDENWSLNMLFTAYRRNWNLDAHTDDVNNVHTGSTVLTTMDIDESNIWQSATVSLGLQRKINTKSDISFNVDYLHYYNDNPSSYNNSILYQGGNIPEASKIDLSKSTPITFLIGKIDYKHEVSGLLSLETGLKAVTSTLDNNVLALRNEDNVWITDPLFTSYSTLAEQIYSGYISSKWQPGHQWQVNGGLRYEYTQTRISTPTDQNLVDRKYGYLFPALSLKKALGAENDFQVSYSKRIRRPTYNDIAPYVFFWGPRTFSAGNTSLYPSAADAFSASYHLRQWIITLQVSHSRKEIVMMQPDVDVPTNSLTYRSQNLKYLNTIALANSYTLSVASWWEVQANMTAQFQIARTAHMAGNITRRLYGLNVNVTNEFKLPKNFSIEVSGTYQTKTLSGLSEFLPTGSLNAGVQKNLGTKGIITLSMDDILNTNYWRIRTVSTGNLNSYFNYHWHNRFIRISYTRSLGNNKLRSVRVKSGSEEEQGRIAN